MDIAKNLANLRKDENLTQEKMAEKLHMSKNGYAKLERGESRITVEHLQNIANTFNIDIEKLLKKDRDFNLALGDNNINFQTNYHTSQEIEKLQLIIDHQQELLAQKDKQIELLEQLLAKLSLIE
ncbi:MULTISPECIES: helix-turn-helix transcriptional regulator [unclassified Moraxella]|uniref:helix-turn-helix domain-containing protein n=1 Tax=unclassified Moraxella TaxID=2685852 RepID=UPI002B402707|nr:MULTISPECIES: helix-turn-helix transcriptional regulator [unclassified Moraxella]